VLLKRVFLADVLECPKCKGRMKIIAAVTAPGRVRRILEHLALPSEAPRLQQARSPPQLELSDREVGGFDARKALQDPGTITWLRVLFAVVPAAAALLAALALRRYPLTRGAMDDIRARLEVRRGTV
jgi:hypothetical protein